LLNIIYAYVLLIELKKVDNYNTCMFHIISYIIALLKNTMIRYLFLIFIICMTTSATESQKKNSYDDVFIWHKSEKMINFLDTYKCDENVVREYKSYYANHYRTIGFVASDYVAGFILTRLKYYQMIEVLTNFYGYEQNCNIDQNSIIKQTKTMHSYYGKFDIDITCTEGPKDPTCYSLSYSNETQYDFTAAGNEFDGGDKVYYVKTRPMYNITHTETYNTLWTQTHNKNYEFFDPNTLYNNHMSFAGSISVDTSFLGFGQCDSVSYSGTYLNMYKKDINRKVECSGEFCVNNEFTCINAQKDCYEASHVFTDEMFNTPKIKNSMSIDTRFYVNLVMVNARWNMEMNKLMKTDPFSAYNEKKIVYGLRLLGMIKLRLSECQSDRHEVPVTNNTVGIILCVLAACLVFFVFVVLGIKKCANQQPEDKQLGSDLTHYTEMAPAETVPA